MFPHINTQNCVNPLTTSLALKLYTLPSILCLSYTHLHPTNFFIAGSSMYSYFLFFLRACTSSKIAFVHFIWIKAFFTSLKICIFCQSYSKSLVNRRQSFIGHKIVDRVLSTWSDLFSFLIVTARSRSFDNSKDPKITRSITYVNNGSIENCV